MFWTYGDLASMKCLKKHKKIKKRASESLKIGHYIGKRVIYVQNHSKFAKSVKKVGHFREKKMHMPK